MLTNARFGDGKCIWCCQTGEGVEAKFQDGLHGFFCKKDLWSALKARSETPPPAGSKTPESERENSKR